MIVFFCSVLCKMWISICGRLLWMWNNRAMCLFILSFIYLFVPLFAQVIVRAYKVHVFKNKKRHMQVQWKTNGLTFFFLRGGGSRGGGGLLLFFVVVVVFVYLFVVFFVVFWGCFLLFFFCFVLFCCCFLFVCLFFFYCKDHAYSNILKISSPKTENFPIKTCFVFFCFVFFHISAQNIDCGYSLEPPRRGGSNEYPQSMFLSRNKNNNVYPCKPQFYYKKVGFNGVKII